ncbi:MAG: putative hydro-lyase [Anaerolineae bacterium]
MNTLPPQEVRALFREGSLSGPTAGLASGYAQANLVILPQEWAYEFLLFCQRNPKPCPLLEALDVGSPYPVTMASGADLRTDLPRYRIYRHGELEAEVTEITGYWQDDLVSFLLGCSFTFEAALLAAGIPVRHIDEKCNVPMYITDIECAPAGRFRGPMVVTMRPIPVEKVVRAVQVTTHYPRMHGAPVHVGPPSAIGIDDLSQPDFGDPVTIGEEEMPLFWACGVTPQVVAREARPDLMITHAPGHMFITDIRHEEFLE